ncbi:LytR/AlgR family response regulator transcription factor [Taibaiella chishuiensis]|uniref:LytTR family two component transcriptional regulator n=1 Tax=Taibaiella chishuiensis TaxID=1434707 RepID=A0A2P8D0R6_9BACT|nr:LytTR family DNA-binding domain-containing protein [Taibaiella chishuiensis]PSK90810.1 LytTR family two component transcriptional regulator [Taibaiella chishuiensis]
MSIRCCLIDDQPAVMELIEGYLTKMPGYEVVAKETDSLEAFRKFVADEIVADLTFMDIDMPRMNGIELGSKIKDMTSIIYLTAHRNYAPESYENGAIDYLVKPVSFQKFQSCIEKARQKLDAQEREAEKESIIFIPGSGRTKIRVNKPEIVRIQGASNYIWVITHEHHHLAYISMAQMASYLPKKNFVRIHKSHIINLAHVIQLDPNTVYMPENQELPISESFKKELAARIRPR